MMNLFNSTLRQAAALAVLFHFIFFLIFQLAPTIPTPAVIHPFVKVESEIINQEITLELAQEDKNNILLHSPPIHLLPLTSSFSDTATNTNTHLIADFEALNDLEKAVWPNWAFTESHTTALSKLNIKISGDLADYKKTTNSQLLTDNAFNDKNKEALYEVFVNGENGKVFWFKLLKGSSDKEWIMLTERFLNELTFKTHDHLEIINGKVSLQTL